MYDNAGKNVAGIARREARWRLLPRSQETDRDIPAQSPLVTELQIVATTSQHDPTRLDDIRDGLEQAIKADSRIENLVALARVRFLWGEIRATTDDQK